MVSWIGFRQVPVEYERSERFAGETKYTLGKMIRFALDAINNNEVSFTEWGIQYWPVKLTLPIGAALMALQGLSKLIKDIVFVTSRRA